MDPRARAEEYLRRMRERGYQDSLMGMDDDNIEYELSKMEEADRRREAQAQQPIRTVYRPVDPGLKARIPRMFGQPYDESAIPEAQKFYLNGWDNGEDEEEEFKPQANPFELRDDPKLPNKSYNPRKVVWNLDLGDGSENNNRGLSGASNGWFSGKETPNVPAVKPLGVYKPGTVTMNLGEFVVGRDGVIRRAGDEEALLKGIFAKSQGQGTDVINTGLFERGATANPDRFVQAMSYNPQTVKEGTKDLQQLPGLKKLSIGAGKDLADQSLDSAQKYAKIKGLNSVEDNEADAFRHFTWNARMAREIGWEPADILASNHEEVDWTENHGANFDENGVATFEIPLSSLMDLHNNHVGRQMAMAKEYGNTHHEKLFQIALKNGNIITALDQVPAFYGFDKNAITTRRIGHQDIPFVRVTYDKNKRTFTFHPKE